MNRNGQQEIVGFVLIVVLVMVGLMVFLVISVKDSAEDEGVSVEISNMLDVLMKTTSDCAIVYEPDYDSYEDLLKSCHRGYFCSNLERGACDYLNESFEDLISSMVLSDATIDGWSVDFFVRDGEGILEWSGGNCSQVRSGGQRMIVSDGESLVVRFRLCRT